MAKKSSKPRKFMKGTILALNIVFLVLLLFSYAASWISPAQYWVSGFLGLFFPLFYLVNILFALFWLITWKKYIFISFAGLLLGIWFLPRFVQFSFFRSPDRSIPELMVTTYNIHGFTGKEKNTNAIENRTKIQDFLRENKADVVCLQEVFFWGEDANRLLERFAKKCGYEYFDYSNYQPHPNQTKINALVTLSRFPIIHADSIRIPGKNTFALVTDIAFQNRTIRVWNLHLASNRFGSDDYMFYSNLTAAEPESSDLTTGVKAIYRKLRNAFSKRGSQVDRLEEALPKTPYPMIVCGDFNDTPTSYTYQVLTGKMNDSYRLAENSLWGNTYAGNFFSFRIDYILSDDHFTGRKYDKVSVGYSDHYPVRAFFNLKR